jgi:hypothetical protein
VNAHAGGWLDQYPAASNPSGLPARGAAGRAVTRLAGSGSASLTHVTAPGQFARNSRADRGSGTDSDAPCTGS